MVGNMTKPNDVSDIVQVKVGDELAFRHSYGTGWTIHKVKKITPSGRIVCGRYTLNPDLRIRDRQRCNGSYRAQIVTPEILAEMQRKNHLDFIAVTKWKDLPDAVLGKVVAAIQSRMHQ